MSGNTQVIKSLLEDIGKHWQSQGSSSFLSKMKNRYQLKEIGSSITLYLWHGKPDMRLGDGAIGSINHQPLGGEIRVQFDKEGGLVHLLSGGNFSEYKKVSSLDELKEHLQGLCGNYYFVEEGRNYSERDWKGR